MIKRGTPIEIAEHPTEFPKANITLRDDMTTTDALQHMYRVNTTRTYERRDEITRHFASRYFEKMFWRLKIVK